ncbi:hypothetical protein [Roseobacter weihaiensis]|uniref:hypothetical protein n=1 Tax=Roseobacter weihaiensis TaxID=2763262 RepID=UPI001D0B824D|nr:hypothetical protein [Roseobacter sp. H9]
MPRIFRLYLVSALNGFGISLAFVAMILIFNVANLRHLVGTSDIGVMAAVAFWILNGIVFSGVQFAWALAQMVRVENAKIAEEQGGTPHR